MSAARSPRAAIKAKCVDCIYDPAAPGSKYAQTTLCSVTTCPLWPYRPTTSAAIPESVLRYYKVKPGDPCLNAVSTSETVRVVAFPKQTAPTGTGAYIPLTMHGISRARS